MKWRVYKVVTLKPDEVVAFLFRILLGVFRILLVASYTPRFLSPSSSVMSPFLKIASYERALAQYMNESEA